MHGDMWRLWLPFASSRVHGFNGWLSRQNPGRDTVWIQYVPQPDGSTMLCAVFVRWQKFVCVERIGNYDRGTESADLVCSNLMKSILQNCRGAWSPFGPCQGPPCGGCGRQYRARSCSSSGCDGPATDDRACNFDVRNHLIFYRNFDAKKYPI